MAQRRRRKYGYKFTEKTQSKKGIVAFILAVLSIAIFIYVIVNVDCAVVSCSRYVDCNLCNWIFNRIVNKGDQDGIQRYL